jgi:hypothetical protein
MLVLTYFILDLLDGSFNLNFFAVSSKLLAIWAAMG